MSLSRRTFSKLPLAVLLTAQSACALRAQAELDPSLASAFAGKRLFGSAITPEQVERDAPDFIRHHFNVVVAENAMKPEALAGVAEGQYDFSAADKMVDFALANGIKVRGHTLTWHRQMPGWFFVDGSAEVSRTKLIARLQTYIGDVVTHFKGRVFAWDVVNEAFVAHESGVDTDKDGMRMSALRRIIGPEYIEIAFRAAAKADPQALLFINDYETQNPAKIEMIGRQVLTLKSRGVKIDGIGHQAHCSLAYPSVADFERAIDVYAALGLTQHVTELDLTLNENLMDNKVRAASHALLRRQAARYSELVSLFLRKRDKISALLVWGIGDAHTWLTSWPMPRFEAPLLFDTQLKPKPAYYAVLKAANDAR
jgi:endo-1,4-beta-xylanase